MTMVPWLTLLGVGAETPENWLKMAFAKGVNPPFSFVYDGTSSEALLTKWMYHSKTGPSTDAEKQYLFRYQDPQTGLEVWVEATAFIHFPAVEWVLRFRNNSDTETGLLEDIQSLDITLPVDRSIGVIIRHALGSSAQRSDFAPVERPIGLGDVFNISPVGGRSSNTTALPFFNLQCGDQGVMVGIGWSGQWSASFVRGEDGAVRIRAGMERTRLRLRKGETIRILRVLLLFWTGTDYLAGHNLLRRFLIAHRVPKVNNQPVLLPLAGSSSGPPDEANTATQDNQVELARHFAQYGVEYLWIDAGWFEGRWPNGVGNWFIRKDGFPAGLRPVSDAVKAFGMKGLVLWFEPERVYQGTWIDREHPDWVIRLPGNPNGLLNLGHPDALRWLTDHLSQMIESEGISVYRHDFNMDPLPFWRAADEPEREGITEIRHIEGLYQLWDELRRRHPHLIIDNCASGGRRLDLETISRSVALWRTDYSYYEPNGYQCHTYGISLYLPTTSTACGYPDPYTFRSSLSSGMVLWVPWTPMAPHSVYHRFLPWIDWKPEDPVPVERGMRLLNEFRQVRHLFFGDFYPLTPYSTADDVWMAYQFHRDDQKEGMVLAFRRHHCPQESLTIRLRGLEPDKKYLVRFVDQDLTRSFTGKDLSEGLTLSSSTAPSAFLITYREE
ncbi:MAG: alpha-galactosidase [Armatimonadetes bacterium]|nr:alpha-galactosidase [Armatimonadota bacterium]MDW8122745.1 alpha-galactosidase [Armatimonadota bacterium]